MRLNSFTVLVEILHTVDISITTYLPLLVYVVCERPPAGHAGCSLTLARRTNPQFGPETSIKVTLAALQHCSALVEKMISWVAITAYKLQL